MLIQLAGFLVGLSLCSHIPSAVGGFPVISIVRRKHCSSQVLIIQVMPPETGGPLYVEEKLGPNRFGYVRKPLCKEHALGLLFLLRQ